MFARPDSRVVLLFSFSRGGVPGGDFSQTSLQWSGRVERSGETWHSLAYPSRGEEERNGRRARSLCFFHWFARREPLVHAWWAIRGAARAVVYIRRKIEVEARKKKSRVPGRKKGQHWIAAGERANSRLHLGNWTAR